MKILIKLIIGIVLIVSLTLYGLYLKINFEVQKPLKNTSTLTFTINSGESFKSIGKHLEKEGIVKSGQWLYWYARINKVSHKIAKPV